MTFKYLKAFSQWSSCKHACIYFHVVSLKTSETFKLIKFSVSSDKFYLISPNTEPAFSVTNTILLSGPPTTCTAPLLMMYISLPMSPCKESQKHQIFSSTDSLIVTLNIDLATITHFLHNKVSG